MRHLPPSLCSCRLGGGRPWIRQLPPQPWIHCSSVITTHLIKYTAIKSLGWVFGWCKGGHRHSGGVETGCFASLSSRMPLTPSAKFILVGWRAGPLGWKPLRERSRYQELIIYKVIKPPKVRLVEFWQRPARRGLRREQACWEGAQLQDRTMMRKDKKLAACSLLF